VENFNDVASELLWRHEKSWWLMCCEPSQTKGGQGIQINSGLFVIPGLVDFEKSQ